MQHSLAAHSHSQAWACMTDHLMEAILSKLQHATSSSKDLLCVTGVCQHWRCVGTSLFFGTGPSWRASWGRQAVFKHPSQLLTLCPHAHAPTGLLRGEVRREVSSSGRSRVQRITFYQGITNPNTSTATATAAGGGGGAAQTPALPGKFLLAAEQRRGSSQGWAIYMDRSCTGKPIAYLEHNALRTTYTLTAAAGSLCSWPGGGGGVEAARGSSGNTLCSTPSSPSPSLSTCNSSSSSSVAAVASCRDLHSCSRESGSSSSSSSSDGACVDAGAGVSSGAASTPPASAVQAATATRPLSPAAVLMRLKYKLHLTATMPRRLSVVLTVMPQQLPSSTTHTCLNTSSSSSSSSGGATCVVLARHSCFPAFKSGTSQQQHNHNQLSLHTTSAPLQAKQGWWRERQRQQLGSSPPQQLNPPSPAVQLLQNKKPHWNTHLKTWCLNFNGRVKLSSAKNLQLVAAPTTTPASTAASQLPNQSAQPTQHAPDPGAAGDNNSSSSPSAVDSSSSSSGATLDSASGLPVVTLLPSPGTGGVQMLFGKTQANGFVLDYDPCVITALQAFAVALTSFGTKILA